MGRVRPEAREAVEWAAWEEAEAAAAWNRAAVREALR
jgi:hypothetical protein